MIFTNRKYNALDIVRLSFQCAPVHSAILLFNTIIGALVPTFSVLVTASLIDTVLLMSKGEKKLSHVSIYIALIVIILSYEKLIAPSIGLVRIGYDKRLRLTAKKEMLYQRARLEYKHMENAETQDLVNRVCDGCEAKLAGLFDNFMGLLNIILRVASIVGILVAYIWWLIIILVVFCVPLFYIGYRAGKKEYVVKKETTILERLANNFSNMLSSRENIDERYVFGFESHINGKYYEAYEKSRKHRQKVEKRNFIAMKAGSILLLLSTIIMCIPLLYAVANKKITYGLFISFIPAINNFAQMMSWSLTNNISRIKESIEYLKDLTEFMNLSKSDSALELAAIPAIEFQSLEFKNVSFRYSNNDNYVLRNMSFRMEKGKHYAIVGANGSGKTTMTKLITGLYDEYEGEILVNEKNIREYSLAELKSLCSAVFQDFSRYSISFGENIAIGNIRMLEKDSVSMRVPKEDINSSGKKTDGEYILDFNHNIDKNETGKKVREAVELFSLNKVIDKLPQKYNSALGKIEEEGVDLSGGEWQRVALARAVISPAQLKILDEPTAALDPISESEIYTEFEKISRGYTTIFISHRLGSTKLADTILVVSGGRILEQGSHEELMKQQGMYSKMYLSQVEWYREVSKKNEDSEMKVW